jgi:hypothetical protein
MSAIHLVVLIAAVLVYGAAATVVARRAAQNNVYILAAAVSAVALAIILFSLYRGGSFSYYPGTPRTIVVRAIVGFTIATGIAVVPPITATTVLATRFAAAASPAVRSWALTSLGAVAVLLLSLAASFVAAIAITGDGP